MEKQISPLDDSTISIKHIKISKLVSGVGIGIFMSSLDATVAVILLEKIRNTFNATPNEVQWVVVSYLLTLMAFTVIAGDLGDKFSNKRVFQIGMLIFTIGSLFCFLTFYTSSLLLLVLARIIQAIGASGIMANAMALVTRFTNTENRGTAVGINNLIISVSVVLGPVLGAVLTDFWNWSGVFLINVPLGVIAIVWCQIAIPETDPLDYVKKTDYLGSFLLTSILTLFILSLSLFVEEIFPYSKIFAWIALATSFVLIPFFIFWEKRAKHPLVDLPMLKNKKISIGLLTAILKHLHRFF